MRALLLLMAAIGAGSVVTGRDAGVTALPERDTLPPGVTRELIERGELLFGGRATCASCHGAEGRGLIGPDLGDAEWWHVDGGFAGIQRVVRSGVPAAAARTGATMPARGGTPLTDDDVRAVAAYVWSLRLADRDSAAPPCGAGLQHRHGAGGQHQHGAGGQHQHGGGQQHGPGRMQQGCRMDAPAPSP
jgi:mono/diheme cytochrome c family protein